MSNLEKRVESLEAVLSPKGQRIFYTYDQQAFYASSEQAHHGREIALTRTITTERNARDTGQAVGGAPASADYRAPIEDTEVFTRADIEALEQEGWQIIIVQYVKKWREDVGDLASIIIGDEV